MTKEALKLALEALEGVLDDAQKVLDASIAGGLYEVVQCRDAITAIKAALAQPEQEPVAWKLMPRDATDAMLKSMDECSTEGYDERLYAGHAASVYMAAWDASDTHPPQRTWVGLTNAERKTICNFADADDWHDFQVMDAVEAKLKKKNHG